MLEPLRSFLQVQHIYLDYSHLDVSAIEMLDALIRKLKQHHIDLHLAEVKGPVMDQIEKTQLIGTMQPGQIFLNTHDAIEALTK